MRGVLVFNMMVSKNYGSVSRKGLVAQLPMNGTL
jgi:hypothetical protein